MQTFMTNSDFSVVAETLDNQRLGKQRVEAYQILNALTGKSSGWKNHPATQMWQGHEWQLANYGHEICRVWISKGFNDSLDVRFRSFMDENTSCLKPWWTEDSLLHLTHQSNLLRKNFAHYSHFFQVVNDLPYVWPLATQQTFRLGTLKDRKTNMGMINGVIYLTASQVAEVCGVSKGTITAYKARGQMPPPDKEFGRTPLWSFATIEAWRNPSGGLPKPKFNDGNK